MHYPQLLSLVPNINAKIKNLHTKKKTVTVI